MRYTNRFGKLYQIVATPLQGGYWKVTVDAAYYRVSAPSAAEAIATVAKELGLEVYDV